MKLRIATFNLENLDDTADQIPSLNERIKVLQDTLIYTGAVKGYWITYSFPKL